MPATLNVQLNVNASNDIALTLGSGTVAGAINDSHSMGPPEMDAPYIEMLALTAGSLVLDLTALPRASQSALDLTGDRVFGYCIKNLGANIMTFASAVTDGYGLFTADGTEVLPGGTAYNRGAAGFGEVGVSASDITVTGTGAQTFQIILWAGPEPE